MLRGDTAVDKRNDDVLAVQALGAAQAPVGIEKLQEIEAVRRCQRPDFVFPDTQNARRALKFMGQGRVHPGGEPVEAVLVAMHQLRTGTGLRK